MSVIFSDTGSLTLQHPLNLQAGNTSVHLDQLPRLKAELLRVLRLQHRCALQDDYPATW
jgi:hypothetical protein